MTLTSVQELTDDKSKMVNERFRRIFREAYLGQFEELEIAFEILRTNGASMMDCTKILVFELGLSLSLADELVVNSKTWGDFKEDTLELRSAFYSAIRAEFGDEKD